MTQMKFKLKISPSLKPKQRVELADAVIEYIKHRTMDGFDKNLDRFEPYTPTYAKFKGVNRNDVDLVFSSEMLEAMKTLSHKKGELTIGYEKGSRENGKAEGNIKGTYGKPFPVTKGRDFLGINEDELSKIEEEMFDLTEGVMGLTDAEVDKIARDAARAILGIQFED